MCMRDVLAVLEDRDDRWRSTLAAAVELAAREGARLTLAKTCQANHMYLWCAAFAVCGACAPVDSDPTVAAAHVLARATEFVPAEIPVTTMVLSSHTKRELRRLTGSGAYDALVAGEHLLGRTSRLRMDCERNGIAMFSVQAGQVRIGEPRPATPAEASALSRQQGVRA